MKRVGILCHPSRGRAQRIAQEVIADLGGRGLSVWRGSPDDEVGLRQAAPDLDLLITLGGDGTIVRAVRAVATCGVPILGVNFGRLGFLAEVDPSEVGRAIEAVAAGDYFLEERMMLRAELRRRGELLLDGEAINDLVMARGSVSRTVRISIHVDGSYVMTQAADGIIISTPTGSTAYCLAAGGPIVAPDVSCMIITPVAAHLALAHAIVVPSDRLLCLRLVKGQGAMLTVDGQVDVRLEEGDELCATASQNAAKFVRFGSSGYFYRTILRRLRWPDRRSAPDSA